MGKIRVFEVEGIEDVASCGPLKVIGGSSPRFREIHPAAGPWQDENDPDLPDGLFVMVLPAETDAIRIGNRVALVTLPKEADDGENSR